MKNKHSKKSEDACNWILVNGILWFSDIIKFDLDLNFKSKFGRSGNYKGPKARYHDIQVDNEGNIYVGDILNNTIQKFKPIKTLD